MSRTGMSWLCSWWAVAAAGCLPSGSAGVVPPVREWRAVFAGDRHEPGAAVAVRRGDSIVVEASGGEALVVSLHVDGGVLRQQGPPGLTAQVRHVAGADGQAVVDARPAAVGDALSRPAARRMMAVERPPSYAGDGGDDEPDGAAWLARRQHLLLATFGVNPTQLSSRTGLSLARALDAMEVYARRMPRRGAVGHDVVEDDGYRFTRTRARASDVDGQRYEMRRSIDTGQERLLLVTRFDERTGRLMCALTLTTTEGTRVEAALEVRIGRTPEGFYQVPAHDFVGDYLAADLYAHGPLDDFRDLAGEAPPREQRGPSEGVLSAIEDAVLGELGDNDSWSAIGGQTAVGFVPIAGQIADARDIAAAGMDVLRGREGSWWMLGVAVAGIVPGLDFLKGTTRASRKSLREASERALDGAAGATVKRIAKVISKQAADQAAEELRTLAAGRVELSAMREMTRRVRGFLEIR